MKEMLVDILKKKPNNVCDFIIEWTDTKGREIQAQQATPNIETTPNPI